MTAPTHVLFDFDGTLIDSAQSILKSLGTALAHAGVAAQVPLNAALIGPPLRATLATLSGSNDPAVLDRLSQNFRNDYDTVGYRQTNVYPGVPDMLKALRERGIRLYIVTNKRIAATQNILDHLAWTPLFAGVYALDSQNPATANKIALVRAVLHREQLNANTTWMVGDSAEDARAASENALRFFAATWGYGEAMQAASTAIELLREPSEFLAATNG